MQTSSIPSISCRLIKGVVDRKSYCLVPGQFLDRDEEKEERRVVFREREGGTKGGNATQTKSAAGADQLGSTEGLGWPPNKNKASDDVGRGEGDSSQFHRKNGI